MLISFYTRSEHFGVVRRNSVARLWCGSFYVVLLLVYIGCSNQRDGVKAVPGSYRRSTLALVRILTAVGLSNEPKVLRGIITTRPCNWVYTFTIYMPDYNRYARYTSCITNTITEYTTSHNKHKMSLNSSKIATGYCTM